MDSSQDAEARYSVGSSAKAMKLLGLTKLPPDASRAEHLSLIQQHRSARLERAKSASPMSLHRGGSSSRLVSSNSYSASMMAAVAAGARNYHSAGSGGPAITSRGGTPGLGQHPGAGVGVEDEEEGALPHHHQQHYQQLEHQQHQQTSEWLDMRESSLKLSPTDVDDQFIRTIADLMQQFPEPPARDCASGSNLSSPTTPIISRNRGDNGSNRRVFHMPKSSSHWRVGGGNGGVGGGGGDGSDMGSSGELVQQRQNPMYVQQTDSRRGNGVHESQSPVRICYAKPEDVFSL